MNRLRSSSGSALALLLCAVLLAGCSSVSDSMPSLERKVRFDPDDFDSVSMHTRHISAPQAQACEAARRALLSQGYLVNTATAELVTGRKYFQPTSDTHYEVEMRVVCAAEGTDQERTAAFASALQDRYVIKKINNSASLGVGVLGSVSLPVSATDDTLVKVGSETVTDARFYDRFFQLFDRYVRPPSAQPMARADAATPMVARPAPLEEREAVDPADNEPPQPPAPQ
ncbi:DUF2242 domain-containing protein [Paracidovorax wautersii]|uniref:DUF2242 domain-containing protein n=1 Tax=Paracidovorax wautersii TaxID=1177982 RepID=A0ABU1IF82_9BURK|nr:DUF2242 domain-containing protein [Paracidovorax wautersii]MDR6215883.1 hypothetical protein [Paracidovorax wautersii]